MSGRPRDAVVRVVAVCDALADILPATLDELRADVRSQWAVEMGLIRIGEGVARLPAELRDEHPAQPWRQIIGMRNFAAHQYDDLDPGRVWRTVTRDVPALRTYLVDVVIPALDR